MLCPQLIWLLCTYPFMEETISLEHFHSLAFLSYWKLFLSPSGLSFSVCFVASCPFFCLLTIGIPSSCSPGQSHPITTYIPFLSLYLSVWPFFQISYVSISTPQASPLPRTWVHLTSFCMSHLSGWCYLMPRPGASEWPWPLFPLFPIFSQSPKLDGGTSQMYLFSLSITAINLLNALVSYCY